MSNDIDMNMDDSYEEIGSSELNSMDIELLSNIDDIRKIDDKVYREPVIRKKTWAELCEMSDDEDDDWYEQNVATNKTLLKELEANSNETNLIKQEHTLNDRTIKQENKLLSISEEDDDEQNEEDNEELVNIMRNIDETRFIDNIKKSNSADSRKRLSDVPLNRMTNFTGKPKKNQSRRSISKCSAGELTIIVERFQSITIVKWI